jgi:predicted NAD-dependent protein-ADP-ribosyltransferase YbiA (DUF1768 family)
MFEITKSKFDVPDIAASLVQKMATKLNINFRNQAAIKKFTDRLEYKQMLLQIRKGLKELNDRQLVDTFFAIGKLHKGYEVNEVGKMLMPLMSYLIGDFLIEF